MWWSRASRKRRLPRRPVRIAHDAEEKVGAETSHIEQRLHHPEAKFKVGVTADVSFWVAIFFLIGSCAWIVNGFYLYLPLLHPSIPALYAAPAWWAFAGGTLFEIGAYLGYIESLNTAHDELFGPALLNLVRRPSDLEKGSSTPRAFRWWGRGDWRDIGFLANAIQLFAASVFWISTLTGLPGVIPGMPTDAPVGLEDAFYWTPQVIGGLGFVAASALLMLEAQRAWWRPAPGALGWHVGFWNGVGAVGFLLCGALGYGAGASTKVAYQSVLATFWGSFAFLIGSAVQLWETLWREDGSSDSETTSYK